MDSEYIAYPYERIDILIYVMYWIEDKCLTIWKRKIKKKQKKNQYTKHNSWFWWQNQYELMHMYIYYFGYTAIEYYFNVMLCRKMYYEFSSTIMTIEQKKIKFVYFMKLNSSKKKNY